MSTDTFVVYSTAHISREEYTDWLHQLNAVMIPEEGGAYDARLSKDTRHVWISLLEEKWFDMDMAEFNGQPEVFAKVCRLLGGEPRSAIVLDTNDAIGSKILAVQFAALCAEHYPCVVLQASGNAVYSRQKLLKYRDAGMGFDGSTWETAHSRSPAWNTRIIEEAKKHEETKRRAQQDERNTFSGFDTPAEQDKEQLEA